MRGTRRLDVVLSANLSAAGAATVSTQVPWGQTWRITGVAVNVASTSLPFPTFTLYRGAALPANVIAATYSGQSDVAGGDETCFSGESITGVWSGGPTGTPLATLHLTGEIQDL